jgi:hypothetical protein
VLATTVVLAAPVTAQERYALIVSGATGGQEYVQQHTSRTDDLVQTLVEHLRVDPSRIATLSETLRQDGAATAANVRRALAKLRGSMGRQDVLLLVLIGHGTFDGVDAKFNLVGPDLEASEWSDLLRGIPGRLVVVNTTSASFPFIERLAAPNRIVITATDSAAQRFDTVFADYFVTAFQQTSADIDKNGRISIWEAFAAATTGVRRHYQQRGQLATERGLLDDNGDGVGSDGTSAGQDGSLASRTYLDASPPGAAPTDEALVKLLQRRTALEAELEELRVRRSFMSPDGYAKEFERLMIDLARVSQGIRQRSKT